MAVSFDFSCFNLYRPSEANLCSTFSIYTEREHRGNGLATIATRAAITEARRRGIRVVSLHASDEGRAIYERLGFEETNEMRLLLDHM